MNDMLFAFFILNYICDFYVSKNKVTGGFRLWKF